MEKAVITNRIILPRSKDLVSNCIERLTYEFEKSGISHATETYCDVTILNNTLFSIPVAREDLIPKDFNIIDKRTEAEVYIPQFRATLRESQKDINDMVYKNCIINAKPGFGKTFTSLALVEKLKQKTLVIVHTLKLRDQWKEEISKVYGFEAGEITRRNFDISPPIVISNTQTLIKHVAKVNNVFGLAIMDEAHHIPAITFKTVMDRLKAKYKIGLSATLERKDGKHILLGDYIGRTIYTPPKENVIDPTIVVVETEISMPGSSHDPYATRLTLLTENPKYIELVCRLAIAQAQRNHKVLVIGDRVAFLEKCHSLVENSVCITSKTENQKELENSVINGEKGIIFGSRKIFSEGVSINELSCLILASPINNIHLLEQVVGRIMRITEFKKNPEVIDIKLFGATGKNQFNTRMEKYLKEGWKLKYVQV